MTLAIVHDKPLRRPSTLLLVGASATLVLAAPSRSLGKVPPDVEDPGVRLTPVDAGAPVVNPRNSGVAAPGSGAPATGTPAAPAARVLCDQSAAPFPHPLITEVYYAVASGPGGDASQDSIRSSSGDEFVELLNPHSKPIQLGGYTLSDSTQGTNQFRFTFPVFELPPGAIAVVFNGYQFKSRTGPGTPIGDSQHPPASTNPLFNNAFVFSARISRSGAALSNEADFVLLSTPAGAPVHRVWWGSAEKLSLDQAVPTLDDNAPSVSSASVQRENCSPSAVFSDHKSLPASLPPSPSRLFSPGYFPSSPTSPPTPAPTSAPTPAPTPSPAPSSESAGSPTPGVPDAPDAPSAPSAPEAPDSAPAPPPTQPPTKPTNQQESEDE